MKKLILSIVFCIVAFSSINAQKIEMKKSFGENMFYQNDKKLKPSQLTELLKSNTEAFDLMKSAKSNYTWATVLGGAGGALVGFPIGTAIGGGDAKWELAGAGAALILVAIPILNNYNKKAKKAVEIYNNGIPSVSSSFNPEFNFNIKGTNMGISMSF
ncbi:hypothetical protein [Polaribacter sp. Hel1_85]|uniref:hypothetical protein n=1 Tax=Polaribacter sp. Hel1_85 TaxID=1250005 RepID=UPI00052C76A4|nr:hypothetical protein [Polaribacter sp. Hel1_85]KGL62033.1 hypothetical protein PHEL85_1820 [Polaribacter sp. Hel1_85]